MYIDMTEYLERVMPKEIYSLKEGIHPVLKNMENSAIKRMSKLTGLKEKYSRNIFRSKSKSDNGSGILFMHYYNEVMTSLYPERIYKVFDCALKPCNSKSEYKENVQRKYLAVVINTDTNETETC